MNWLSEYLDNLHTSSVTNQIAVGGVSGWISGFFTAKFGKASAYGVGISLVLFYLAQKNGYIEFDFQRFNKDVAQAKKELQEQLEKKFPNCLESVKSLIKNNGLLALTFSGGFLFGLASG